MKLNAKGEKLRNIWQQNYFKENNKLGGDSANSNFVEGWSIIDNKEYVKTLTDFCGLMLYGYDDDDCLWIADEWIEMYGENSVIFTDCNGKSYTCIEVKTELLNYFDNMGIYNEDYLKKNIYANENFIDDEEKMVDFYELSKEEFLFSYSYLTEEEYDNTAKLVAERMNNK